MNQVFNCLLDPFVLITIVVTLCYLRKHRYHRQERTNTLRIGAFLLVLTLLNHWHSEQEYWQNVKTVAEDYKLSAEQAEDVLRKSVPDHESLDNEP